MPLGNTVLHHIICKPGTAFIFYPRLCSLNNSREWMANLVQSITCFDTAICLRGHINCLGSVWGNIVSCFALLCWLTLCSTATWLQVDVLPEWWWLHENTSQNLTMCPSSNVSMCVRVCKCVHFSEAPDVLTGIKDQEQNDTSFKFLDFFDNKNKNISFIWCHFSLKRWSWA